MNGDGDSSDSGQSIGNRGIIIAFHTNDYVYTREAGRLAASARRLNLPIEVTTVESTGSWVENCSRKPAFILDRRRALRGPLLYLDVDAVVHADPWPHLNNGADMAFYYPAGGSLISATIFLRDTPGCEQLVEEWRRRAEANPRVWDQAILQQLVDDGTGALRVGRLPREFCYVFTGEPDLGDPIIEQLQASREWRAERRSLWRLFRQSGRSRRLLQLRRQRVESIEKELGLRPRIP